MTALQILLVGAGSALGGVARFVLSQVLRTGGRFPWVTLTVNVAGWIGMVGSKIVRRLPIRKGNPLLLTTAYRI